MIDPFELNEFMDEAFNKGIRHEQERIIKLLESYEGWKTVMEHDSDSSIESVIALIKGEGSAK